MFSGLSSKCDTYCSSFPSINKDGCPIKKDDAKTLDRIKILLNDTYSKIQQQFSQKYLSEYGIESINFDTLGKNQSINAYIASTFMDFVDKGVVTDTGAHAKIMKQNHVSLLALHLAKFTIHKARRTINLERTRRAQNIVNVPMQSQVHYMTMVKVFLLTRIIPNIIANFNHVSYQI